MSWAWAMTVRGASNWGGSERSSRPLDILVVDDDPMNQALLGDVCEAFGWRSKAVDRGDQVLPALSNHRPDLVLLDLMLPGRDGFAVLEDLRSDPDLAAIPVVVVSAISDDNAVWRASTLGVRHYLVKPISLDELRRAVDEVLSLHGSARVPPSREALLESMERLVAGREARLPSALVLLGLVPLSGAVSDALTRALLDDFPRPQWIYRMGGGQVAVLIPGGDFHEAQALMERLSKHLSGTVSVKARLGGGVVILDERNTSRGRLEASVDDALAALGRALARGGGMEQAGR